jgi:uncharacterized protein with HEPN domain
VNKDPVVFLRHILESITLIESYVSGVSKRDFLASRQLQDSVIRRIEIVGEAVKNLPADLPAQIQTRGIADCASVGAGITPCQRASFVVPFLKV